MAVEKIAARAGAAVLVLGLSLAGPQACGVAAADSDAVSSTAADPSGTVTASVTPSKPLAVGRSARGARVPDGRVGTSKVQPAASATALPPRIAAGGRPQVVSRVKVGPAPPPPERQVPAEGASSPSSPQAGQIAEAAPVEKPLAIPRAGSIAAFAVPSGGGSGSAGTDWFTGLTASLRSLVEGAGLLVRRTLFNKAPTMDPVQTGGQVQGLVTGTIGGLDPEGDTIAYSVMQAPRYGSVALNADGSYTYTPGSGFTGVDSFGVAATDTGLHVDLLDLLRPASTQALVEVSQSAAGPRLTFNFVFGSGSQLWSNDARNGLLWAARDMASYLVVAQPVSITYDVTGRYSPFGSTLATAGSDLVSSDPGFFDTVVQQKIISGIDANGSAPDGQINWNFFYPWAFGDSVGSGQYDLRATAMHELTHSLGFLSVVAGPGSNTSRNWTTYDGFVVDAHGNHPIGGDFAWDAGYDANLTGGGGGLYFGGTHAVAPYGGLVPLYTPSPWAPGSSMSHLARSAGTGPQTTLMYAMVGTGLGTRVFSPVERGILQDLGYTVVPAPQTYALLFVGLVFARRRNSCAWSSSQDRRVPATESS